VTEILRRDAHKGYMVECQVHAHLMIGGEYFIGETKGTIESFLAEGGSGGQTAAVNSTEICAESSPSTDISKTLQIRPKLKSAGTTDHRRIHHHIYCWASQRCPNADG
jgi:hypothetical protein